MFVAERLSRGQNRLPSPACRDAQRWFTTTSNIGTISCRGWSSNSGWISHHNLHPKLWNFAPCDVQSLDLCCKPACSCILWINCWRSWPRWLDAVIHCVNIVSNNPSLFFFNFAFLRVALFMYLDLFQFMAQAKSLYLLIPSICISLLCGSLRIFCGLCLNILFRFLKLSDQQVSESRQICAKSSALP